MTGGRSVQLSLKLVLVAVQSATRNKCVGEVPDQKVQTGHGNPVLEANLPRQQELKTPKKMQNLVTLTEHGF
jgi:hypothetical protein